jgi:hypothetical protein
VRALHQASDVDIVYTRATQRPEYGRDLTHYLENVAHTAHVSRAVQNGTDVPAAALPAALGFLHEGSERVRVDSAYVLVLSFDVGVVDVYELHIERLSAPVDVDVRLALWDGPSRRVHEEQVHVAAGQSGGMHVRLARPVRASRASLELHAGDGGQTRVTVGDLRVQAQTPALRAYVGRWIAQEPSARATQPATNVAMNASPSAVK